MSVRITCTNKSGDYLEDRHETITTLGWVQDGAGTTGRSSRDEMHDWIAGGGDAYVVSGTYRVKVTAVKNWRGTRYVKTLPDGTTADNLLRLPECG